MPPRICVTDATSVKSSPSKVTPPRRDRRELRDPRGRAVDGVVGQPRPRGVAAAPAEGPRRVEVAQAAGCIALAVGSMTSTRSAVRSAGLAGQQRRERALGERQLLATEEHEAQVDRAVGAGRRVQRELEHHRDRALHVGRAEAVDGVGVAAARAVALRGHGVQVPGEEHERAIATLEHAGQHAGVAGVAGRRPAVAQHAQHVGGQRGLVARLATARRRAPACALRGVAPGRRSRAARRGMLRRCASAGSTSPPARPTSSS